MSGGRSVFPDWRTTPPDEPGWYWTRRTLRAQLGTIEADRREQAGEHLDGRYVHELIEVEREYGGDLIVREPWGGTATEWLVEELTDLEWWPIPVRPPPDDPHPMAAIAPAAAIAGAEAWLRRWRESAVVMERANGVHITSLEVHAGDGVIAEFDLLLRMLASARASA